MDADDKVALIDLDGTVADYDGAMTKAMRELSAPGEQECVGWGDVPPYIEARRSLIKRQPGFWRNLPRLELGFDIVDELRKLGFALHVLTKGPRAAKNAWTEKAEWCEQHLPDAAITVSQDKSLVYGRVLVDDFPPYFTGWLKNRPRGLVICVAHVWNQGFDSERVFRYDGTNRFALRELLSRAYSRPSGIW
jgi:5'-nucleotidase